MKSQKYHYALMGSIALLVAIAGGLVGTLHLHQQQFQGLALDLQMIRDQATHLESGAVYGSAEQDEDWELLEGRSKEERVFRRRVIFQKPFPVSPQIVVGISRINTAKGRSPNIQVRAENVDSAGFDIVFTAWDRSVLYSLEVNWLAYSE